MAVFQDDPDAADVVSQIREPRSGRLPSFYRVLLANPELAAAWNRLGVAARSETGLEPAVRELVICATARSCGSEYIWTDHRPLAQEAGIDASTLDAVGVWPQSEPHLDEIKSMPVHALLEVASSTANRRQIGQASSDLLGQTLGHAGLVEAVATSAYYCAVAGLVAALRIEHD